MCGMRCCNQADGVARHVCWCFEFASLQAMVVLAEYHNMEVTASAVIAKIIASDRDRLMYDT
jgi:hypothetical protein